MDQFVYIMTHLQQSLSQLFGLMGDWGYLILFLVIFAETGLVIFPWLPGESLIFFASSLAGLASSSLKMSALVPTFFLAALIGDTVNYLIGIYLARWPWLKRKIDGPALDKAHLFFTKYGILAVIFGRFVPLVRTFIPLVSGVADLKFSRFSVANLIGVALWVGLASVVGYFFGSLPFVQRHYSLIALVIICVAMLPATIAFIIHFIRRRIIKRNKMM